jgi:hypothetical protein
MAAVYEQAHDKREPAGVRGPQAFQDRAGGRGGDGSFGGPGVSGRQPLGDVRFRFGKLAFPALHRAAVRATSSGVFAAVEDGRVHLRKVTLVRDMGTRVEVNDGVRDGDRVIMNPPVNIPDGQAVNAHVVEPPK